MRQVFPNGSWHVRLTDRNGRKVWLDVQEMERTLNGMGYEVRDLHDVRHDPTEFGLSWKQLWHLAKMLWRNPEKARKVRFRIIKPREEN